MRKSSTASLDYEVLWQNTSDTLASLSSLRISWYRIKPVSGGQVIVGGFGDVEQAKLRSFILGNEPDIALKKLRPSGDRNQRIRVIASLARELDVWSKLNHPNILKLEGFYLDERSLTSAWIATRWQRHGNILKYIEVIKPDLDTRLKLALDTARGLAYLHGLSPPVSHGDIKAENVLISDQDDAMLCDFGLAKVIEAVPSGLTTTTTPSCSIRYAAPELILGGGSPHTLPSDVWAWGCVLLVVITDILPYASKARDVSISYALSQGELPVDVATIAVPEYVRSVIGRCLQRTPDSRPDIAWCQGSLTVRTTTNLFDNLSNRLRTEVPSLYKIHGDGWEVFRNPEEDTQFEYDVAPTGIQTRIHWSYFPRRCQFLPDGRHIATPYPTKLALHGVDSLLNPNSDSNVQSSAILRLRWALGYICDVCFSRDGRFIATGDVSGHVMIWNFPAQTELKKAFVGPGQVMSLTFADSDHVLVAVFGHLDTIRIWRLDSNVPQTLEAPVNGVERVVASPRHPLVITLCRGGALAVVFNTKSGAGIAMPKSLTGAAFVPDGRSFISWSWDAKSKGMVMDLWDLVPILEHGISKEGTVDVGLSPVRTISTFMDGPQDTIVSLSVSPDGRLAALESWDKETLLLWDLESRQAVMAMTGPRVLGVKDVMFRPGSTFDGGTIMLTSVNSGGREVQLVRYKRRPSAGKSDVATPPAVGYTATQQVSLRRTFQFSDT